MRRPARILVLLVSLLAAADVAAAEDASVEVRVDQERIRVDEQLVVKVELQGEWGRYEAPDFEGFEVVGRQQSKQIRVTNGRMVQKQAHVYRLRPRRAGTLTIGAATLHRGGRRVAGSEPVEVKVVEPEPQEPTSAKEAAALEGKASEPMFVHVHTPREAYYVHEPFPVTWSFYYRPELDVQQVEVRSRPSARTAWTEELLDPDRQPDPRQRRLDGRTFRYIRQSRQLVRGREPGTITLDPMAIRVVYGSPFQRRKRTVRSAPFEVRIEPLPEEGRPDGFYEGNVGDFDMEVELRGPDGETPEQARTGDRLVLHVVVRGTGNLVGLEPPEVEGGEPFEVRELPSGRDDRIRKDAEGMHGERRFRFLLTPREPGEHPPPTVRLPLFDPAAERYRTLTWEGDPLDVEGRPLHEGGASKEALPGRDVAPLVEDHRVRDAAGHRLAGTPLFWGLLGGPLAVFLVVEGLWRWRRRRERDVRSRRSRAALSRARKRLNAAERFQRDGMVGDFYGQVSRALLGYFDERANLPAAGMTWEELRRAAAEVGYPEELVDEVLVELENCDFARFSPTGAEPDEMRDTVARVRELLRRLDAVQPRRRP